MFFLNHEFSQNFTSFTSYYFVHRRNAGNMVTIMSVCLPICLRILKTTCPNFTKISVRADWSRVSPLMTDAIRYALPVLWMTVTSCFNIRGHMWCLLRFMADGCQSAGGNAEGAERQHFSSTPFTHWLTYLCHKPLYSQQSLAMAANSALQIGQSINCLVGLETKFHDIYFWMLIIQSTFWWFLWYKYGFISNHLFHTIHVICACRRSVLTIIIIIRPHCSTTYVDAAYYYRPSSVVCWSVTLVSPAKTAAPIELPFGLRTCVGPGNHVLDGVQIPPWEGANFGGELASHCKV